MSSECECACEMTLRDDHDNQRQDQRAHKRALQIADCRRFDQLLPPVQADPPHGKAGTATPTLKGQDEHREHRSIDEH